MLMQFVFYLCVAGILKGFMKPVVLQGEVIHWPHTPPPPGRIRVVFWLGSPLLRTVHLYVTAHAFCASHVWSKIFKFLRENLPTNTKVFLCGL